QLSKDLGVHVLINFAGNESAAKETLLEIQNNGGSAELLQFDVKNNEEVIAKVNQWIESNPDKNIEILVNNAGITRDNLFPWVNEKDWDDVINTSVKGMYN